MYINRQKIFEIMDSENVSPLENESEIEDLIVTINSLNKKIDFLNGLKKNRVKIINEDIEKNENRKSKLQEVIMATLEKINEKSLSFPGVGKVVVKHPKGKWLVKKEEELIELLKKELTKDDFDAVVPSKPSIAKKELNKILDVWEKSGKLPESVEREEEVPSLTVVIEDGVSKDSLDESEETDDVSKDVTDKGYDSITI